MRVSIHFIASLFSIAAVAAPTSLAITELAINNPDYVWQVTDWEGGCQRAGCYYNFNISGPSFTPAATNPSTIPPFSAYCNGMGEGAPYAQCEILDDYQNSHAVAARLMPVNTTGTGAHIQVSYQFVDLVVPSTYYNYTGNATTEYNQFVEPLLNFTVTPSSFYGVA